MAEEGGFSTLLSPAREVGRHFALVGALTTLVAALIPVTLVLAGAPGSRPDLSTAFQRLGQINLAQASVLAVTVVALGLVLYPLQFAATQLLEGYWGTSPWGRRAMTRSTLRHLERRRTLTIMHREDGWSTEDNDESLRNLDSFEEYLATSGLLSEELLFAINADRQRVLQNALPHRIAMQEAGRLLGRYPSDPRDMMPTRLGNVLRRYERLAGEPYGLDAVNVVGPLVQVVSPTLREYHDDARSELDLLVRMVGVLGLCSASSLALLWQYDVWLLVPLTTAFLTYIAYRGTVSSAEAYGEALVVLIALGRERLYAAMHVGFPRDTEHEVLRNEKLMEQLQGGRVSIRYDAIKPNDVRGVRQRNS
jgi:hypothetical protein